MFYYVFILYTFGTRYMYIFLYIYNENKDIPSSFHNIMYK